MKERKSVLGRASLVLGMLILLTALVCVSALAVNPGEIELNLTYNAPTEPTVNGTAVTSGYVSLEENGAQVATYAISSGTATTTATLNTGSTYVLRVMEGLTEPYYREKEISLSPAQVSTAVSSGLTLSETVDYVEWTKPVKVHLVDQMGLPVAPANPVDVTVTCTEADPVTPTPTYQVFHVTKATNAGGTATFFDFSYDPNDPSMCNIFDNRILVSAVYTDPTTNRETTVAQFFDLAALATNEVDLVWPGVTVSGTVYDLYGAPVAGKRVAVYLDLMAQGTENYDYTDGDMIADTFNPIYVPGAFDPASATGGMRENYVLHFPVKGQVYYTATDASGNYVLSLPMGMAATLCVVDPDYAPAGGMEAEGTISWMPTVNYDYLKRGAVHFPWIRTAFAKSNYHAVPFMGLQCMETTPLTCTPYGNLTNQNLSTGRTQYTLKGNVEGIAGPVDGATIYLNLSAPESTASTDHNGSFTETGISYAVTNGVVNKTDVKLQPGTYSVALTDPALDLSKYQPYPAQTINITAADIAPDGEVNFGTLVFTTQLKPPSNTNYVSGGGTPYNVSQPTQPYTPASDPGYGYVVNRMEEVEDPAYGAYGHLVTIHYTAFHTNAAQNSVSGATLTVDLPAGISVVNAGGMSAAGTSATGITLTKSLGTLSTGETFDLSFAIQVDASSPANYYAILCTTAVGTHENTGLVTLQRLRINLNAPRLVAPATKFTAYGDVTGAGETGVILYSVGGDVVATGAKKGRYFYFTVPGQQAGTMTYYAKTDRAGSTETSNQVTVQVATGLPEVSDMYIVAGGVTYPKNSAFGMVYYTGFVSSADLAGPAFDVYVKAEYAGGVPVNSLTIQVMGMNFPAAYDAGTGYWKATVSGYYAYGDYELMALIDGLYTTQVGRLLLLF